ncbi:maleylpyruvate isomerase family mycothiol-dependent enzyme [Mycobacterium sp.]|uniref:maleylpyruvate isomerase family mycothiol-dependent enzyme n=1 Tax=Mycobacterium sp. TaxID=1785 RepID=UPI003C752A8F
MTALDDGIGELHLAVCRRFGEAVRSANGKWERRSPCDAWDARAVLEHVIGFHDVLLLRPLGLKPNRPQNPLARWKLTYDSLTEAFNPRRALFEKVIGVPKVGKDPATRLDARKLVPSLTRDVLVHTWDLARAVGADDRLDPGWCELCYANLPADLRALSASGMFNPPVAVNDGVDMQARLLARLGRDPSWRPDHS